MPVTVNINNLSLCHKGSNGISMATIPDVCKTPAPPAGPVPIPYPNIAMSSDLMKGTSTVKADGGNMCAISGSEFCKSTGDEPGSVGGVMSNVFIKEATWITYSFDVKFEGKGACRLTDKMFHNHQNTVNMGGELQAPLVPSSAPASVSDCKELAKQAQEGDIVVRSTPGSDSDLIRKLGKCEYSHAGIVTKNAAGDLVVTDAYPGRNDGAVKNESVEDFFCNKDHGPPDKGTISRPNDPEVAKKAAEWAQSQTTDPAYTFDIFSDFRGSPNEVYCSDFVHQAFENAGVDIVPSPMDFMSSSNKKNTIDTMRDFAKTGGLGEGIQSMAEWAPDFVLKIAIKTKYSNFKYVTPCQVANSSQVSAVASFP